MREEFQHVALVECRLETGRTHQIRVHMKHIHHPLLCDPLYGTGNMPCASIEAQLAKILQSHDVSGEMKQSDFYFDETHVFVLFLPQKRSISSCSEFVFCSSNNTKSS